MTPTALPRLVAVVLLAAGAAASAQEGFFGQQGLPQTVPRPRNFSVEVALVPSEQAAGGSVLAQVRFSCKPEHYVWADSIKVTLAGGSSAGIAPGKLVLPKPKRKHDEFAGGVVEYLDGDFTATLPLSIAADAAPGRHDLEFTIAFTGCGPDLCEFGKESRTAQLTVLPPGAAAPAPPRHSVQPAPAPAAADQAAFAGRGRLAVVVLAFLGGLGLALTPCVYPLIPITISLIGATATGRRTDALVRSLVYVFGISVTYSVVGVVAAATGGVFGAWLQRPAVYLALAAIFAVLAGAMLDLYQIGLTSQRLARLQAGLRGKGGLAGIWFIGLLSGAAATACIAPVIIGALTYVMQSHDMLLGWLVFFAMAWGMGAPLVVLGTFAGLVRALPKSGQWMVAVKRAFSVALLAVAVYYVGRSRVLSEFWFRALVCAFLLAVGVFAGAFDSLAADAGWRERLRKTVGLLFVFGAVVALVAALRSGATAGAGPAPASSGAPAGVAWLRSEPEALAQAKAEGKPVLLFFSADWCAPCHEMLRTTFADAGVVAESRRFVCATVDLTDWSAPAVTEVRDRYGIYGAPTVVLVGTDGSRRSSPGYIGPSEMLRSLRPVR